MSAITVRGLEHRYGGVCALDEIEWDVPEGALYALLGPNGAGKTTLMRIVAGTLRPSRGTAQVFGVPAHTLEAANRQHVAWVAESQRLPRAMTLRQLEGYVAPLYERWDAALADELRQRFELDPGRRIGQMSRGQQMKSALLIALAPRPRLLLMDEPFTGMDVMVKDEIVKGLLGTCTREGCTVVISSHDLAELELLADHVGFLKDGRFLLSAPLDEIRSRYVFVEAAVRADAPISRQPEWLFVERAGRRLTVIAELRRSESSGDAVIAALPECDVQDSRPVTLRELFIALATARSPETRQEVAA